MSLLKGHQRHDVEALQTAVTGPPCLDETNLPDFDPSKQQTAPIFIAGKVSLAVSSEKDGKLRLVYAGWDHAKVLLLGTALMAEADSGPFMTRGDPPYGSSMAIPLPP